MKKIFLVFLAVCLIVGLAACNDKSEIFTLTFDTQEGGENVTILLDGSDLKFPNDPVKQGYDFKGWFYDKDVYEKPVSLDTIMLTGISKDTVVYAKWVKKPTVVVEEPNPDVEFNTYGGTAVAKLTEVDQIIQSPQTTKAGYSFLGWFESLNAKKPIEFPYTPEQNITLHAKWKIINYSITYNLDGGNAANPSTYNIETDAIALNPATRIGHTFKGWYSDSAHTSKVTTIEQGTEGNLHFFAKWEINAYKLKYYLDGSVYNIEGEPVELSFLYGNQISGTIVALEKEGYNFSGWKLNNGSEIPEVMPDQDLNVYGHFTPKSYTITYYSDDVFYATQDVLFGTQIIYRDYPTKENSTFSGWKYLNSSLPVTMPASNIEIKGYFTDTFALIYKLDGQEYFRKVYKYNDEIQNIEAPQRAGYQFSGWTGLPINMPATDLEVTGTLVPNVYKLYFTALQEGAAIEGELLTNENGKYIEVQYDENFIYRLNEVKGILFAYDFAGWTLQGEAFNPVKWGFTNDITVVASWTEKHTQGLKYTLIGGNYTVTGYSGLSTQVFVPSSYNGLAVSGISANAFRNNSYITAVTIHNGVSRLGSNTFQDCISLTTVNLPASIQNIEAETFNGCVALQSFTIPSGVGVIGNAPFRGCTLLSNISVNENNKVYKAIDGVLYSYNGKSLIQFPEGKIVTSFAIPNEVETLGNYAFYNCNLLTEISISNSLTSIGCYAFAGTSITQMTVSNNVTWIGSNAFDRCTKLVSLSLPFVGSSKAEAGTSEGVFGYIFGNYYFENSVAAYQWYDSVNYVKYYLPSSLISVTLTNTQYVPFGAFSGCVSIQEIELKNAVFVGEKAFLGCSGLDKVTLPRTLTGIDTDAFNSCISLTNLVLPVTLTFIGDLAFYNCTSLVYEYEEAAFIEGNYTYILEDYNDSNRTNSVYISSYNGIIRDNMTIQGTFGTAEVVSIGKSFMGITGIKTLLLPIGVTSLDRNAFAGCGYLAVYAPSVSKPADWKDRWDDPAIYWNASYDDIYIKDNYNFYIKNNEAIITRYTGDSTEVIIPTEIPYGDVNITVKGIGKYAFAGNSYIESVRIPASITQIGNAAFADCQSLTYIEVDSLSQHYMSEYGVLYNKSGTRLIQYPVGKTDVDFTVQASVTTISSLAFANAMLQSVTFTTSLSTLEAGAFLGCALLKNINYLNITNITAIEEKTFFGCEKLEDLFLPTTIISIGNSAFEGCKNINRLNGVQGLDLRSFTKLTNIGNKAFAECGNLTFVSLPVSLIKIGYSAFQNCIGIETVTMADNVLAIGNMAFAGCRALTQATISANLARMSALMFSDCVSLVSLTIPFVGSARYANGTDDSVFGYLFGFTKDTEAEGTIQRYGNIATDSAVYFIPNSLNYIYISNANRIPYGAFSNINTLIAIEISNSVTDINAEAFAGCSSLEFLVIPFIGTNRNATGAEAVLGYLFETTDSENTAGIKQAYADGQENYYLIPAGLKSIMITDATQIGYGAFYNMSGLIGVSFNANIISIAQNVLYGCTSLETLEIPFVGSNRDAEGTHDAVFGYLFGSTDTEEADTVQQYYGLDSFAYYFIPHYLTEVIVTSADRIPYGAFMNTSIESILINDGTEEIGKRAFENNLFITEIRLPNSLLNIGAYAFNNNRSLSTVYLNKVETIGDYAFRNTWIQELNIPDSVKIIGKGAFSYITFLQTVTISVYNSTLISIGDYAFEYNFLLQSISLPNSLVEIGQSLFSNCYSLKQVSLPYLGASRNASGNADSMLGYVFDTSSNFMFNEITQYTVDGEVKFYIPDMLTNLVITNATQIYEGSLSGIPNINVSLNEGITTIKKNAFYKAEINSLYLPASIESIEESAFEDSMITQITFALGSKLTFIKGKAFLNSQLNSISVPAGVLSIGDYAFNNNIELRTITFASAAQLAIIGNYAFQYAALTRLALPASLKTIGNYAFENCTELANLSFAPNSLLERVGNYALANTAIINVVLPSAVQALGDYAFAYTTLKTIGFGTDSNLMNIGSYAFAYSQLQTFAIPEGVNYVGVNPFYETPVANLNLSGYRTGYKVEAGVLYTKDGSVLISYPKSLTATNYSVPNEVIRIDAYAFASNPYIKTISLPSGLLSIGYSAFMDCTELDTVSFRGEGNLMVIEEDAFLGCTKLRIFNVPSTLMRIEERAFGNTDKLASINLTDCSKLSFIGENAFEQSGINSITLPQTLKVLGEGAFKNAYNLVSVNLQDTSLVTVEKETFYGCVSLLSITLPSTVQTVGESAFQYCDSLTVVSFQNSISLAIIDDYAFADTAIQTLTLPQSLQLIGQHAFNGCNNLTEITVPFIGSSAANTGYIPSLNEVFGNYSSIESITITNSLLQIAITEETFRGINNLKSLTLGKGVVSVEIGSLRNKTIENLNLLFAGTSIDATGSEAVLGSIFGFGTSEDAGVTAQQISDTQFVYAFIPSTLKTVVVGSASGYGAFSNITSLISITVTEGDTLGKNLVSGCNNLVSLSLPFVGSDAQAENEESSLLYLTRSPINSLINLKVTKAYKLTTSTFPAGFSLETIEVYGDAAYMPEGLLANCLTLENITLPFVGESATATGKHGLFGYLYGFKAEATAKTIKQYYANGAEDFAYSEIPATITSITLSGNSAISSGAFYNMNNLRYFKVLEEIFIGEKAFYNCNRLQSIEIGGNAKILSVGDYAFYGAAFESITISARVETIGKYAFANCHNLISVVFESGSNLKHVEEGAFLGCEVLQSIVLPQGTLSIGERAFAQCNALSDAIIPSTVTSIGEAVFEDCNITSLSLPFIGPDNARATIQHKLGYLFGNANNNVNINTLRITAATFIAEGALQGAGITALYLNEGLIQIGANSISNVPINNIVIPASVSVIERNAFSNSAIRTLSFRQGSVITTINDNAFMNCSLLGDVVIPDSVTYIGSNVFAGCLLNVRLSVPFIGASREEAGFNAVLGYFFGTSASGITQKYAQQMTATFAVPATLRNVTVTSATKINYGAFSGCISLTEISINSGVTSIGALALEGCTSLVSLTIPFVGETAAAVGTRAVMKHVFGNDANSGLNKVYSLNITSAVTIAEGALQGMSDLANLSLNNVTSIHRGAFAGCLALESLTVPYIGARNLTSSNQEYLLGYWFATATSGESGAVGQPYGDNLSEVAYAKIPVGLRTITVTHASRIGYGALSNLTQLTSVTINKEVTDIGKNAFKGSMNIQTLTVPFIGASRTAVSENASITYMFGSSPSNLTVINITDATRIRSNAFAFNTKISTITLAGNIVSIDNNAFMGLTALKSITIPASVTSIGASAFEGCTSLKEIIFAQGSQLKTIGASAFKNTALTSLAIPNTVISIGQGALEGINTLERLTTPFIGASVNAINQNALLGYMFNFTTAGGTAITQIYDENNNATYTKLPANLYSITITNATTVAYGALYNCSDITEVMLNNGIVSIGAYAFANCDSLTSIAVPDSVNIIGSAAFTGCSSLESIVLPFAGASRAATGAISLFGFVFGTVNAGTPGATQQYFDVTFSRIYYIPEALESITITSATKLDYGVFYNLSGVTSIAINEGITAIPAKAFYNCASLISLVIPSTVVTIEGGSLERANSLVSLTVPFAGRSADAAGVQSQFGYIFGTAVMFATNVVKQSIAEGNTMVETLFNIPFTLRKVTVTAATQIKDYAFNNCASISTITFSKKITYIGNYAFAGASSLSVLYADFTQLTTIGDGAFLNCRSFLGIDLSDALLLKQIGERAFMGCASLNYVNLPEGLTNIGKDAFADSGINR